MREVRRQVPAPEALGVDLIRVPLGSDVELDLRLESVVEGVLVSGTAQVPLSGECGRCLEALSDELVVDLQELFAYAESDTAGDEETARMEGDLLDLEPLLRDAVVLALPLTPLCRKDCAGLCVDCGGRLDDLPADHAHDAPDPRWAGLAGLLDPATGQTAAPTDDRTDRTDHQEN
jgi:uncharacterized protein